MISACVPELLWACGGREGGTEMELIRKSVLGLKVGSCFRRNKGWGEMDVVRRVRP